MSSLISVLMPALNEERSIEAAIRCVLEQRGVDLEILVVVGRSVDNTRDVVDRITREDPRVRRLDNPRSGIPFALNIGLAHCRGDFVARVDAHSTIDPDYLRHGVEWLEQDPRLASVGGIRLGCSETPTGRAVACVLSSPFAIGNSINHYSPHRQLTDHASFAVTRIEAAREVGGWDETLQVNEDVDFDHRLRLAGYAIGFDPRMKVFWHVQDSLPKLFHQFRRYGRGKGLMIRKNGASALRLRHVVPPLTVVGGTAVLLGGLARPRALLLLVPYATGVAGASAQLWWRHRQATGRPPSGRISWPWVPACFVTVHTAWGLGMLEGCLLGRRPARASGNSAVRRQPAAQPSTSTAGGSTTSR